MLREGYDGLSQAGETGRFSTLAAWLAEALYAQGRYDEAEEAARASERATSDDDLMSQTMFRAVRAKVLARRGEFETAERLARDAVQLGTPSDDLSVRADTLMALAEVLRHSGRAEKAVPPIEEAIQLYEQKGNLVSARSARVLLDELVVA